LRHAVPGRKARLNYIPGTMNLTSVNYVEIIWRRGVKSSKRISDRRVYLFNSDFSNYSIRKKSRKRKKIVNMAHIGQSNSLRLIQGQKEL
jgi:hypothetical protein